MTDSVDTRRLEDAITLVARHMKARGLVLTRTKLVKLLYFVDLEGWEQLGHPVTGVEWTWHHYGPFSREIVDTCKRMRENGEIEQSTTNNFFGGPEYHIDSLQPMYWAPPSRDLERLVRQTVARFGALAPNRIGDLSYSTEPMRSLISAGGDRGDVIDFPQPEVSQESVAATIERYRAKLPAEQIEFGDVATALRDESSALDLARRSAGSKVIG